MMRTLLGSIIAAMAGFPAFAEGVFVRPEGCERIATVQTDICEVKNTFDCATETGAIARTETFDSAGLKWVSTFNRSTGFVTKDYVRDDESVQMWQSGASDADIVRTGSGTTWAVGEVWLFGMWRPISAIQNSTYAKEMVEIAGKPFHRIDTVRMATMPPPMPEVKSWEIRAFSEELKLSVVLERAYDPSVSIESEKLVDLFLPGQSGFGDEQPRYGCDELSGVQGHSDSKAAA